MSDRLEPKIFEIIDEIVYNIEDYVFTISP
jgi:hypothetical protein